MPASEQPLETFAAPTPLKLSLLWASMMFCFVYGDYLGLYVPGKLASVAAGEMGFGRLTPGSLAVVALMMALPGLMIGLSALLPPVAARALNVVLGPAYAAIMILTLTGGAPPFYVMLAVIEIALAVMITIAAWRWPRRRGNAA